MYNYIILSTSIFGSIYLMSKSLECINRPFIENREVPTKLILVNGFIFGVSSTLFIYTNFRLLNQINRLT